MFFSFIDVQFVPKVLQGFRGIPGVLRAKPKSQKMASTREQSEMLMEKK
jgi:hypothetical protein